MQSKLIYNVCIQRKLSAYVATLFTVRGGALLSLMTILILKASNKMVIYKNIVGMPSIYAVIYLSVLYWNHALKWYRMNLPIVEGTNNLKGEYLCKGNFTDNHPILPHCKIFCIFCGTICWTFIYNSFCITIIVLLLFEILQNII